ncbi:hypothetical protein [Methylocella silvestris]|uniref:hypothetical protein n=1 Tax=Methylocella silvestris TaxID=199596 RepID=UPI00032581C0|nr:hypothetical protein [Methylocella silvestris]
MVMLFCKRLRLTLTRASMPLIRPRHLRRANLLIQRGKLILRPANIGVPLGILNDCAVVRQLSLDKIEDQIRDMKSFVTAEALRPVPKFQRLLFAAFPILLSKLGELRKTLCLQFLIFSHGLYLPLICTIKNSQFWRCMSGGMRLYV